MTEQIKNFSQDVLVGDITNSGLTVVLSSATTFPTSGIFRIRIGNELLIVESVSGDTLTIQAGGRGAEGTVAASHQDGDDVFGPLTKVALENIIDQRAGTSVTMGGQVTGPSSAAVVAASHSGATHAAVQAAAESTASTALGVHAVDTTSVHGITDTTVLATSTSVATAVSAHTNDTVDAHDASAISFTPAGTISSTDVQAAIEEVAAEAGGGGGGGSFLQGAVVVASNDMPATVKAGADFVCDGTADEVQINLAIDRASAIAGRSGPGGAASTVSGATQRGIVQLTGGRFNISSPILLRSGVRLSGAGTLTDLKPVTTMSNAGAGTGIGVIKNQNVNVMGQCIDHIMINMSGSNAQHGIYLNADGASYTEYPSNHSGDACTVISDYNIYNGASSSGITLTSNSSGGRGYYIEGGRIQGVNNIGISTSGVPDGHISNTQIGSVATGYSIAGGNCKITNCKAFYADTVGFALSSGRGVIAGCEVQDSASGYNFSSQPWSGAALEADTCANDGFVISSSNVSLAGISAFLRSGGRYGTMTNGIRLSGSPTDIQIVGNTGSTVTTGFNGTPGARSFVRVSTGSSLVTFG